ncbi:MULTISPECIES: DUF4834 family protein [unclassified Arenibacter]|jgi:hypothetical protein|uniref:DUF4834 family protein n=1 Tax=unclassified Arenibacter TaxID=2615047 RepID=UPI000E349906|nr:MULTISPECIES: DUF4834 family protein [unclassified Arenibacter]MCM4163292.1 DUF4834 domain-containing protein [Arenibacter sp. A80]RFT57307.1 DUF4834 family protein [Arenibacter sp. P308M17]
MGFLKTVLIVLLVYYLFKILAKWFAPKLFRYAAKKTEEHFKERFEGFAGRQAQDEEQIGDVIIDKKTTKKKNSSKNVGEYIDFEEIE